MRRPKTPRSPDEDFGITITDGREDEYVPTAKERRRLAMRRAEAEARIRVRDAWLAQHGGSQASLSGLREELYRRALAGLAHEIDSAETSADRTRAMGLVVEHQLECARLEYELNGKLSGQPAAQAQPVADDVPREEKIAILRKLARTG